MIALDTNILLRYLIDSDQTLGRKAQNIIEGNKCFISRVVLLETYQVLESFYQLDKSEILNTLKVIFGIDNLVVEDYLATSRAVEWYEAGMDFADALALVSANEHNLLVTFDRKFAHLAKKLKTIPSVKDVGVSAS